MNRGSRTHRSTARASPSALSLCPGKRAGTVALVGRPNVGKSTLLNAIVGEPLAITSARPQTTREPVVGVLTRRNTQLVVLDTPGLHRPRTKLGSLMNRSAITAARDADVVVLVVEAPRRGSLATLDERDIMAAKELVDAPPRVVVITKIDGLRDKALLLPLTAKIAECVGPASIVPVSARRDDGVGRLVRELSNLLPEQPFLFDEDTLTVQPMRFFVAEFVREQVLVHVGDEVPHGVAVAVERFEDSLDVPRIEVTLHAAREAHKKILVGAGGAMMKRVGAAARSRIESLLGRRVHLRLWVRATPGWMNDEARLRELSHSRAGVP